MSVRLVLKRVTQKSKTNIPLLLFKHGGWLKATIKDYEMHLKSQILHKIKEPCRKLMFYEQYN